MVSARMLAETVNPRGSFPGGTSQGGTIVEEQPENERGKQRRRDETGNIRHRQLEHAVNLDIPLPSYFVNLSSYLPLSLCIFGIGA